MLMPIWIPLEDHPGKGESGGVFKRDKAEKPGAAVTDEDELKRMIFRQSRTHPVLCLDPLAGSGGIDGGP
jgi:hypothetical protein